MFATQTLVAASLVLGLGGSALAQVADDPPAPAGEAPLHPPSAMPAQPAPTPPPPYVPTGRFQIGAWYSTDDQVGLLADVSQSNLFGTGDLLALDARISARRQLFTGRFVDPHFLDSDVSLGAEVYSDRRVLPGFARDAVGTTATASRSLGDHVHAFVGYRLERVTPQPDDPAAIARGEDPSLLPLRDLTISSLRAGIAYSTLDSPRMPLHGTSIGATLEVADPRWGSDVQLTRMSAWMNTHQPLGPLTMHVGARFNSVTSTDPEGVPLSERLFLDGSSELRGFAPGALGPIDPVTGVPIGGNYELTGTAELEAPLVRSIGLSAIGFYDAGGIFDVRGVGQVGQSVGFGLRWRSPLGPMELAYAFPLGGGSPRLVFGIGASF